MQIDETRNGDEVQLPLGETLELALAERPTSGYRWSVTADGQPVCTLLGDVFEPPGAAHGAGGVHRWRFRAAQAGSATLELVSRRAWEQTQPPARTFTLHVHVSPPAP